MRPEAISSALSWRPITIASGSGMAEAMRCAPLVSLTSDRIERCEANRHLAGDALQLGRAVGELVYEPVAKEMLGRKRVCRQQVFEGNAWTHQVRKDGGIDRCWETTAHLQSTELGAALGDHEIAAHGQRKAARDRMPLDDRHRRLGEALQQVQDVGPILVVGQDLGQRRVVARITEVASR